MVLVLYLSGTYLYPCACFFSMRKEQWTPQYFLLSFFATCASKFFFFYAPKENGFLSVFEAVVDIWWFLAEVPYTVQYVSRRFGSAELEHSLSKAKLSTVKHGLHVDGWPLCARLCTQLKYYCMCIICCKLTFIECLQFDAIKFSTIKLSTAPTKSQHLNQLHQ